MTESRMEERYSAERILHSIFSPPSQRRPNPIFATHPTDWDDTVMVFDAGGENSSADAKRSRRLASIYPSGGCKSKTQNECGHNFSASAQARKISPIRSNHEKKFDSPTGRQLITTSPMSKVSELSGSEEINFATLRKRSSLVVEADPQEAVCHGKSLRLKSMLADETEFPNLHSAAKLSMSKHWGSRAQTSEAEAESGLYGLCQNFFDSPDKQILTANTANLSRITSGSSTPQSLTHSKNTLNFSLSPQSVLQGVDFVDTPTENGDFFFKPHPSTGKLPSRYSQNNPGKRHAAKSPHSGPGHHVCSQPEDDMFPSKIVRGVYDHTEHGHVRNSNLLPGPTRLACSRDRAPRENPLLIQENEEMRLLEKELKSKIVELERSLDAGKEHFRLVTNAERGLRIRRERELTEVRAKNEELNEKLRDTYAQLEKLRTRHGQFRMELVNALGIRGLEAKDLSPKALVASIQNKIQEIQRQAAASSVALNRRNNEDRARMDKRIKEELVKKKLLEEENKKLTLKIQECTEEVVSSRAYIDQLLRTSQLQNQNDWERSEGQYKTVIQNLRKQVRKQAACVSLDLYKEAVAGSQEKQRQLEASGKKIASLEAELKESRVKKIQAEFAPTASNKRAPNSPPDSLEKGCFHQRRDMFHTLGPSGGVAVNGALSPRHKLFSPAEATLQPTVSAPRSNTITPDGPKNKTCEGSSGYEQDAGVTQLTPMQGNVAIQSPRRSKTRIESLRSMQHAKRTPPKFAWPMTDSQGGENLSQLQMSGEVSDAVTEHEVEKGVLRTPVASRSGDSLILRKKTLLGTPLNSLPVKTSRGQSTGIVVSQPSQSGRTIYETPGKENKKHWTKNTPRAVKIRDIGGRRVLQDTLKKMRSPTAIQ